MTEAGEPGLHPWEQRDDESEQAFEAFMVYRDLGLERSLAKTAARLGKSLPLIEGWASPRKHQWRIRVLAWDRMEARETNNRIVQGRAAMRERQVALAVNIQTRVAQRIFRMTDEQVNALKPLEAAALMRAAAELEQKNRTISEDELMGGERTDNATFHIRFIEKTPDDMVPVRTKEGHTGFIPKDKVPIFLDENEGASVIQ